MPCALTKSFDLGCKELAGGVAEFKVLAIPSAGLASADYTIGTNNEVTISVTAKAAGWKRYQLRQEVAALTETINANPQSATLWYQDEFKFSLENFDSSTSQELDLLAKNRLLVAIKTNAGKVFLMGLFKGADVTTGSGQTGTAYGDKYGYEMTMIYKDTHPIYEIPPADYDSLT